MAELTWFKSSYSGSSGDDCVEVALDWHKSSYSGSSGDNCVEVAVAPAPLIVHIRDSKNKAGAHFTVPPTAWSSFIAYASRG